jgi:hypothetical protein
LPFRLTARIRDESAVSERRGSAPEALSLLRRWHAAGYAEARVSHHGNDLSEAELIQLVEAHGHSWSPRDHEREPDMNEIARPKF